MLELPRTQKKCWKEYMKTDVFYDTEIPPYEKVGGNWVKEDGKNKCLVNLGIYEYNLLRSWADEYFNPTKPHVIQTLYEENSIFVNMGPGSDFTWCGESKQKLSLIMKDSRYEPSFCKQVINRNFEVLDGQIRINLAEFTNCEDNEENNYQDLDEQSFQCVNWEDIKMSISLNLNECYENLETTQYTKEFIKVFERACKSHERKCDWTGGNEIEGYEKSGKLCSVLKENTIDIHSFTNFTVKQLQSLKSTKFTGCTFV